MDGHSSISKAHTPPRPAGYMVRNLVHGKRGVGRREKRDKEDEREAKKESQWERERRVEDNKRDWEKKRGMKLIFD